MKNFRQLEYRNCDFIEDDLNIGTHILWFYQNFYDHFNSTFSKIISAMNWFAPETLRTMEFTTKSDIWSFGILMGNFYSSPGISSIRTDRLSALFGNFVVRQLKLN